MQSSVTYGDGGGGQNLALQTCPYPPPLALYEDVVRSRDLFLDTLKKLHISMGTKFMIPIVGGRDLDLHRLFMEVTSRGGIAKVLKEKKWKEVTAVFNFPSSATNASFILRKYYISLIYHYEQIYFFKAKCWTPSPTDTMQNLSTTTVPHRLPQTVSSMAQPTQTTNIETSAPQVCGVIDGKFDNGYMITVKIGAEELQGVLYQVPDGPDKFMNHPSLKPCIPRRKRRKKSEIRKRDPAHPKPNRSGYNFFFAEQHARLKPHYHGRDREISRIIGESWNKLQEPERAVYQQKAQQDKERYKMEMEAYRERLRTGEIMGSTVAIQTGINMADVNCDIIPFEVGSTSAYTEENEMSTDKSNMEGYESAYKDAEYEECSQADMELKNVDIEVVPFDLQTRQDEVGEKEKDNAVLVEDGLSVPIQGMVEPASY